MFDIILPFYFFTKEHLLNASNKRTHMPLLNNQFASYTCKFNIDKIT